MGNLGTRFSGGLDSAGGTLGLNGLRGFFQTKLPIQWSLRTPSATAGEGQRSSSRLQSWDRVPASSMGLVSPALPCVPESNTEHRNLSHCEHPGVEQHMEENECGMVKLWEEL